MGDMIMMLVLALRIPLGCRRLLDTQCVGAAVPQHEQLVILQQGWH